MNRQPILTFNLLLIFILPCSANAEEISAVKVPSLLAQNLVMTPFAILAAQDPEGYGSYMSYLVAPLSGFFEGWYRVDAFNWKKAFIWTGSVAAYGGWNISMRNEDKATVALANLALFNTIFLIERARTSPSGMSEKNHSPVFSLRPRKAAACWGINTNFSEAW